MVAMATNDRTPRTDLTSNQGLATLSELSCNGCGYHASFRLSSTPVRNSSVSPAVYITKLSAGDPSPSQPPLSSSFLGKCESSPLLSPIMSNDLLQLSPIPTGGIRNGSEVGSAPPLSPPTLSPIKSTGSGRSRDIYNANTINGDCAGIGKEIHIHIIDESINDGDQLDQDLIPQASPTGAAQSKISMYCVMGVMCAVMCVICVVTVCVWYV